MKIAILGPISIPFPSNGYAPYEKVVTTLATGLQRKGHDVTVFAAADSKAEFNIVTTVDLSLNKIEAFKFHQEMIHITEAAKVITQNDFDIVHNHLNWNGLLALEITGKPYVTTIHGYEAPSNFVFQAYKEANYISISNAQRKESPLLHYIDTIYHGIDFEMFKKADSKEDFFFVGARILREKGIHNAIKLAKLTNTRLYIAGLVIDEVYFKEEVEPHLDDVLIKYLGNISQEEIIQYVSRAKAYLSLLEWDEPFGLSVAEAIACGTPVIATKRGSMIELVKNTVSGILVENTDEAIKRIHELNDIDPDNCRKFGEKLFSIEKMIEGHIKVYNKILQRV